MNSKSFEFEKKRMESKRLRREELTPRDDHISHDVIHQGLLQLLDRDAASGVLAKFKKCLDFKGTVGHRRTPDLLLSVLINLVENPLHDSRLQLNIQLFGKFSKPESRDVSRCLEMFQNVLICTSFQAEMQ